MGRALGLVVVAAAGFAGGLAWAARGVSGGGGAARGRLAHRADGSDDSGSWAAGIADEGSIPDDTAMADTMPGGLATPS